MNEETLRKIIQEETRAIVQEETRAIVQEETRKIIREEVPPMIQEETDKLMDLMTTYANSVDDRFDQVDERLGTLETDVAEIKGTIQSYPLTENIVRSSYRKELDDLHVDMKKVKTHLAVS